MEDVDVRRVLSMGRGFALQTVPHLHQKLHHDPTAQEFGVFTVGLAGAVVSAAYEYIERSRGGEAARDWLSVLTFEISHQLKRHNNVDAAFQVLVKETEGEKETTPADPP